MSRRDSITALLQSSRGGGSVSSRVFQGNNNPNNDSIFKDLELELQHAKMQLQAERDHLNKLEQNLKNVIEQQYKDESNIIQKLRTSQDVLRQQLSNVVQSKLELCTTAAKEIDKLRSIIQLLMSQIFQLTGKTPQWLQQQINNNLQANHFGSVSNITDEKNDDDNDNEEKKEEEEDKVISSGENINNNNNNDDDDNKNQYQNKETPYSSLQNNNEEKYILKKRLPGQDETGFPHLNPSCVDIRNIKSGDGINFPDPYCTVVMTYTGYVYEKNTGSWRKVTDDNFGEAIFTTTLGSGQNIIGLEQAILTMSLGQTIKVWIPSRLGYGSYGAPKLIPSHSDLIFQVQLLAIKEAEPSENNDGNLSPNEEFHNFSINNNNSNDNDNNNNNIQNNNDENNVNNANNQNDNNNLISDDFYNDTDEPASGFDQDL